MSSINVSTNGTNINLQVTPTPRQTININRGLNGPPGPPGPSGPPGPPGPPGSNDIGGYPVNLMTPQNYDALMFVSNEWTNIPQTQITDGGNY